MKKKATVKIRHLKKKKPAAYNGRPITDWHFIQYITKLASKAE